MEQKGTIVADVGSAQPSAESGGPSWLAPLKALGPGRIVALGVVALTLLAFFAYIITRAVEQPYTLLFSGLALADTQQLAGRLDALGVPYRLSSGGDAILVPANEALRLRMTLAEEGLPVGNTVGYELFDQTSPFATTETLTNINLRRALEGELARTIQTIRGVRAVRVHIVEPKRGLFGREEAKPSASIVLSLSGAASLDKRQIAGIRHLVAAAVTGLDAQAVTIVDGRGELLAQASDMPAGVLSMTETEDYRVAFETRLRAKIVQLLERSVGPGRVDAVVTADLDFDEVSTTAEVFDPTSQVVRSTQTTEEANDLKEQEATEAVTVANNLPTERTDDGGRAGTSERSNRTEETVNYEISRTVKNQTKRGGTVRRLSIAVQVDGLYQEQPDGTKTYQARPAEELEQLAALVRSAAGVDEERGDVVEVVNRQFAPVEPSAGPDEGASPLDGLDHGRITELAVLAGLTLLVLFFGVRPAILRLLPEKQPSAPAVSGAASTAVILGPDGKPLLVHAATGAAIGLDEAGKPVVVREPAVPEGTEARPAADVLPEAPKPPRMVDLRQVRGQVRASLVNDVAQVIEEAPGDAVRVIRSWLHDS